MGLFCCRFKVHTDLFYMSGRLACMQWLCIIYVPGVCGGRKSVSSPGTRVTDGLSHHMLWAALRSLARATRALLNQWTTSPATVCFYYGSSFAMQLWIGWSVHQVVPNLRWSSSPCFLSAGDYKWMLTCLWSLPSKDSVNREFCVGVFFFPDIKYFSACFPRSLV